MIFAPIPNLIFARDIGIVINDCITEQACRARVKRC
jgi:hypothetical protein